MTKVCKRKRMRRNGKENVRKKLKSDGEGKEKRGLGEGRKIN